MPVISKFTVGGHEVTKYNNQRLRQFEINGEVCPFAKVAQSLNGILSDPISYRIHRLQAAGNSSQATGSVPKYNCQGHSSVLNIGSFIKSDIYSVPITADGITATFSQSDGTYAITGTSSAQGNVLLHNQITLVSGHKYLVPTYRDATAAGASYFQWGNVYARGIPAANFYWPDQTKAQSWAIVTGNGTAGYCIFNFRNNLDTSVTGFDPSGCFNLIDLTELYGAGNEPANPETVFQDYPEIPVGNDSWIKNDAIRSISSITIGGQTVSVDLRSAGSVYDEWSTNSRGTRKIGTQTFTGSEAWEFAGLQRWRLSVSGYKRAASGSAVANLLMAGFETVSTAILSDENEQTRNMVAMDNSSDYLYIFDVNAQTSADLAIVQADTAGLTINYEKDSNTSFAAGSPLTLASGLTPTDQDGSAITFTETTEATPSPNYPEPIVNSTLISITDGQDTNSAAVDLAGLTDRDEIYVNVKSTNIWDEEWEEGTYNTSTGEKQYAPDRLRSKNAIPVDDSETYRWLCNSSAGDSGILYWYDANGDYLGYDGVANATNNPFTPPAGARFVRFRLSTNYGTTYNHDISISLGSSAVPYMPHDTIGKVWYKANTALVDLASLSWTVVTGMLYESTVIPNIDAPPNTDTDTVAKAEKYIASHTTYLSQRPYQFAIIDQKIRVNTGHAVTPSGYVRYPLASPIWSDITSSAMGAALLALETIEETSNTITINNSGLIDMVQYFTPI